MSKSATLLYKIPMLIAKASYYRVISSLTPMASELDLFGRCSSFKLLLKWEFDLFFNFICNPVSIVRYFEIPFVASTVDWDRVGSCLDISSPRIYLLYMLNKHRNFKLDIVNPDIRDLDVTSRCIKALIDDSNRVTQHVASALRLPMESDSFDVVSSISVIEHIPESGDSLALLEMWRVLKPGGFLLLTFPCSREYVDEYRDKNVYELDIPRKGDTYFFQRIYDATAIEKRILKPLGVPISKVAYYGEKLPGTYSTYEARWIEKGLSETVKDPYLISTQYKQYDKLEDMPGIGVCCLMFEKGAVS